MSEAESTCLYHMINYQSKPAWQECEIISTIPSEQDRIQQALEKLLKVIDELMAYIGHVLNGQVPGHAEVGMKISDTLGSLSLISTEKMSNLYRDKVQELIMVSYLSSLTKTQVMLSEKLNSIL